jgi:hypothetical protein
MPSITNILIVLVALLAITIIIIVLGLVTGVVAHQSPHDAYGWDDEPDYDEPDYDDYDDDDDDDDDEPVRGMDEDCTDGLHQYCLSPGCLCECHVDAVVYGPVTFTEADMALRLSKPHLFSDNWYAASRLDLSVWLIDQYRLNAELREECGLRAN